MVLQIFYLTVDLVPASQALMKIMHFQFAEIFARPTQSENKLHKEVFKYLIHFFIIFFVNKSIYRFLLKYGEV